MKVLSLFDWMACWYEALLKAWIKVDKYYASEIDKYAIQIALKNHPDIIEIWDVTQVKWEDYQDIDLLIGGSPCQWFSMAWKMLNFDDPRSKLFFEFVRLLKEIKPKYFLLENVKMKKEFRDKISELMGVEPILIDSAKVSAQHRERYYRTNIPVEQPEDKWIMLRDVLIQWEVEAKYYLTETQINTIKRNFGAKGKILNENESLIEKLTFPSRINQLDWLDIKCPTLCTAMGTGGGNVPAILENYILTDEQIDMISKRKWYEDPFANVKWPNDKMGTLTTHCGKMSNSIKLVNTPKIRKLHPIECERLQTLPDNYTEGVSDTQRYKMLWNGWTVDVIAHIFKSINWNG